MDQLVEEHINRVNSGATSTWLFFATLLIGDKSVIRGFTDLLSCLLRALAWIREIAILEFGPEPVPSPLYESTFDWK
jgi:hypothetical protein